MEEITQDPRYSIPLEILYQDEVMVAINKPNGLLVHRSPIATNTNIYAVQELRNQIGQKVSPAHRLDRKTSGILLFGLNLESLSHLQSQFENRTVHILRHCSGLYRR